MSNNKTKSSPGIEPNVHAHVKNMEGNILSTWWRIGYQQKKNDEGNWVDDLTRPRNFLWGQGKTILKLKFEEILRLCKLATEDQKEAFNLLLEEERSFSQSTDNF